MKSILSVILFFCSIACSPYKKIVLSASERLTKDWKGASEMNVSKAYGAYKQKVVLPDGYLLRFDYSYAAVPVVLPSNNVQVRASNQHTTSPMLPRATDSYNNNRSAADSIIKRIDFIFDKSQHVQYVEATGFPDSVYYIKRK
ncbi:MAG TPA: hypothetical protein VKT28_19400 [Puia sp.]|nr:hypothetical protein [Puia sp.]